MELYKSDLDRVDCCHELVSSALHRHYLQACVAHVYRERTPRIRIAMVWRLCCWLLVATSGVLAAEAAATASQRHLIRIPLESDDHLRFTGAVQVGSPPRPARVVFDTGSSDTWVASEIAVHLDNAAAQTAFSIGYGGGVVSGLAVPTDLRLGGSEADALLLHHVPVGVVDSMTAVIPDLEVHGVVGLGMETLVQINTSSSLLELIVAQQGLTVPVTFSIFISSHSSAHPPSQLIFGGEDHTLIDPGATRFVFSTISDVELRGLPRSSSSALSKGFGFWALRVRRLEFDNELLPLEKAGSQFSAALLDSGTSVLLLPQHAFHVVVQGLLVRFGKRLLPRLSEQDSLPTCRCCQVHEFPPLAIDIIVDDNSKRDVKTQRFVLRGSDYARCDWRRRECTAMIDLIHSSEVSDRFDVVILGPVFFRAFYPLFDYSNKYVQLACTLDDHGVCPGGLEPALDYRGQPYDPDSEEPRANRSFVGVCAAVTALALLAGLRMLLSAHIQSK
ncbi:unnamed protein product [Phytophthora lilii]|uniref:Unnamed protein product n=1 Tax=Phytophthora lilii TaxID=2077276 RepID=A0A9W7CMA0_9STRA|nr:unnamed protein product [Phytophthora lilii]